MSSKSTFSNSTSRSYAVALYELSKENHELDNVEEGMKNISELLNKSSDFKKTIFSPTVAKDDKKKIILSIADKNNFSPTLKKFMGLIAEKNRLFFLSKIIDSFLNLVSDNKGELKAKLISSKELSLEDQKKIQNDLSKDFKSTLSVPTLIFLLTEYSPVSRLIASITLVSPVLFIR